MDNVDKVYIVTYDIQYEGSSIVGVFNNKDKAMDCINKIVEKYRSSIRRTDRIKIYENGNVDLDIDECLSINVYNINEMIWPI